MFIILGGIWIITITVLVLDPTIPPMNYNFAALISRDVACNILSRLFVIRMGSVLFITFSSYCPTIPTGDNVLVFSHVRISNPH